MRKKPASRLLCAAVAALVAAGAAAGPLEDGDVAYGRGDFAAAARSYRMAADRGVVPAQNALGRLYELGQGVQASKTEAARWYRRAAEGGSVVAMVSLATLHAGDRGPGANAAEGARWLTAAAELGHAPAQAMLGFSFASGHGVARDPVAARMWLTLAASRLPFGRERDEAVRNRESIAQKLTREQNDAALAQAAAWRPRGAAPEESEVVRRPVAPPPAAQERPPPAVQTVPARVIIVSDEPRPSGATFLDALDLTP